MRNYNAFVYWLKSSFDIISKDYLTNEKCIILEIYATLQEWADTEISEIYLDSSCCSLPDSFTQPKMEDALLRSLFLEERNV